MKRIIYKTDKGLSVIVPAECGLSIEEIAQKDVPKNVKYKIIDKSELPQERDFRNAWDFDFSTNFDGKGL